MKQFLLISSLILCQLISKAQLEKGTLLIGGSLGFYSQNNEANQASQKTSSVNISPGFECFVSKQLSYGGFVGYSNQQTKNNATSPAYKTTTTGYGIGASLSQYKSIHKGITLFLKHKLGYELGETKISQNTGNLYKGSSISYGLNPGALFSFSKKILFTTQLNNLVGIGYTKNNYNSNLSSSTSSGVSVNTSTSLSNISVGLLFRIK